jgi:hypothetical protein
MLKFRIASARTGRRKLPLDVHPCGDRTRGFTSLGAGDAVLSAMLAFGKGWGKFDGLSTFGANQLATGPNWAVSSIRARSSNIKLFGSFGPSSK